MSFTDRLFPAPQMRHFLPVTGARQSTTTAQAQLKPKSLSNLEKNMVPPLVPPMAGITGTPLSLAPRWCSRLKWRIMSLGTPPPSLPHKSLTVRCLSGGRIDLSRRTHAFDDRHLTTTSVHSCDSFLFPTHNPSQRSRLYPCFTVSHSAIPSAWLAHCGLWCARLQLSP
jgi:hypothetical protein